MNTFVSKIHLPEKKELIKYIDKIYESGWLTNNGPLVQELEKKLQEYLSVKNLLVTANGTASLQLAIKTLEIKGEVVTSPFTYVATSSAILAEKLLPVYTDVEKETFNLDPRLIEESITKNTSAIIPVHVFGNACDVDKINKIAKKHKLKVIYDAAHAFGVNYKNESILSKGDISIVSFHATKFFHTIEGGAIIVNDGDLFDKAKTIRNYGFNAAGEIECPGFNAKMNEFEAAMGLCNLAEIEYIQKERKKAFDYYNEHLKDLVTLQQYNSKATLNYSYIAVLFKDNSEMCAVRSALSHHKIYPRQYFYPSLDTVGFSGKKKITPVSRDIADRILVLPMHSNAEVKVCEVIKKTLLNYTM